MSACTIVKYYKTSEIKKTFVSVKQKANKGINDTNADYQQKKSIYKQLTDKTSTPKATPYPKMKEILNEMSTQVSLMKSVQNKIGKLDKEFTKLLRGKKEIVEDSSEWKRVNKMRQEYKSIGDQLNGHSKKYTKKSNEFSALSKKHKISKVNMKNLKNQVTTYQSKLSKRLTEADQEINNARTYLNKLKQDGKHKNKIPKYRAQLKELEDVLSLIPAKQKKLEVRVEAFEEEVGENATLWVGPGMKSFTIMQDVQEVGNDINKTVDKYNQILSRNK